MNSTMAVAPDNEIDRAAAYRPYLCALPFLTRNV